MNDPSQALNRSYGIWPPPHPPSEDPMGFANPVRLPPPFAAPGGIMHSRMNWNAKKDADKRKMATGGAVAGVAPMGGGLAPLCGGGVSGYKPPSLNELQFQNRVKARRFCQKKKFPRFAPFAPRNTTSFIIRAKKFGGIASQVSPYPVTPAVLPTPKFSPTREVLTDMVKEEWGVDGYGSMKGRIRLRSPRGGYEIRPGGSGEDDMEDDEGSSESDVEEHLEVERRLDHDVSRFEMVYPRDQHVLQSEADLLESRVDDQDARIARLEEENLTLKERLFLVEREMGELRRRLHLLQPHSGLLEREVSSNNNDNANNHNKNNNNNSDSSNNDVIEECSAGSSGNPTLDCGERSKKV
ncbi:flap endonuclease 1-like [Zingiber officinale]|uniref:flap endonuclease 1-like n=1 Tax=Zingiber officinale TaxID=94328 RepID=UPI001C4C0862|nr:flap endonuclease 1-like [Zingiber officinale]